MGEIKVKSVLYHFIKYTLSWPTASSTTRVLYYIHNYHLLVICVAIGIIIITIVLQVFVMWNWEEPNDTIESDGTDSDNNDDNFSDDPRQTVSNDSGDKQKDSPVTTHSVIFKCMGTMKGKRYQELLPLVALKTCSGETVPVRLQPEPNNPKDSNAIAFECHIGSKWERIGYVVHEAINAVHHELQCDSIISVKFEWVRFIPHCSRSVPGWYCGIAIMKKEVGLKRL